jgi:hypothetical protein
VPRGLPGETPFGRSAPICPKTIDLPLLDGAKALYRADGERSRLQQLIAHVDAWAATLGKRSAAMATAQFRSQRNAISSRHAGKFHPLLHELPGEEIRSF